MSLNLIGLKKLAAKVKGGSTTAASVPGNTNDDVIEYMASNFQKPEITKLELSIGSGEDAGKLILKAKLNTGAEQTAKVLLPTE